MQQLRGCRGQPGLATFPVDFAARADGHGSRRSTRASGWKRSGRRRIGGPPRDRRLPPRRARGLIDDGVHGNRPFVPGAVDLASRIEALAERLTDSLKPLARGRLQLPLELGRATAPAVFRDINPHRWELSGENPVRFLNDLWPAHAGGRRAQPELARARSTRSPAQLDADARAPALPARPGSTGRSSSCAPSSGSTPSMPIYSGGLGVLAGDILKEASDQALEMIGIGLLYRRGYFRQRLDIRGRQQEYWLEPDPKSLPIGARRRRRTARRCMLEVQLYGAAAALPGLAGRRRPRAAAPPRRGGAGERRRRSAGRPARLYEGNRAVRLAQYGLLGIGGRPRPARRSGSSPRSCT